MEDRDRWIRAAQTGTLTDRMGIELLELTAERVTARMPVGRQVHQPFGFLHGGASVALAETVASIAGWLNVDPERYYAMGLEINANHLRSKRDGVVLATATPLHRGRQTHVWEVRITDEAEQLVCIARCTLAILPREVPGS